MSSKHVQNSIGQHSRLLDGRGENSELHKGGKRIRNDVRALPASMGDGRKREYR